jgi:hypothetical protein
LHRLLWQLLQLRQQNTLLNNLEVTAELSDRLLKVVKEVSINLKVYVAVAVLCFTVSDLVKVVARLETLAMLLDDSLDKLVSRLSCYLLRVLFDFFALKLSFRSNLLGCLK